MNPLYQVAQCSCSRQDTQLESGQSLANRIIERHFYDRYMFEQTIRCLHVGFRELKVVWWES